VPPRFSLRQREVPDTDVSKFRYWSGRHRKAKHSTASAASMRLGNPTIDVEANEFICGLDDAAESLACFGLAVVGDTVLEQLAIAAAGAAIHHLQTLPRITFMFEYLERDTVGHT
ncbi:hypothetical protein Vretifemale_15711, partial [Volvox reticuliferus]